MNIVLIGPRAAGKSTIGPHLASLLNWSFVELDELAIESLGYESVIDAWRELGESAWREAEANSFEAAQRGQNQVIALGGGAPLVPRIRVAIEEGRKCRQLAVAYLNCQVDTLQHRLQVHPGDRPSLTGVAPTFEVETVLKQRGPTYLALADFECDTTNTAPAESAARIADCLRTQIPWISG